MAADLAGTRASGLRAQLCGDAHLPDFGAFASPERRLVFDLNDFDETLPGPFEWDVKRLVASMIEELAGHVDVDAVYWFLRRLFTGYTRTLPAYRRRLLERFTLTGVARKVVGVGSVGTEAWILLMEPDDGVEPLLLQAKQSQRSVLADYAGQSEYHNQGERVVAGQQLMQAVSDIFLGWQIGECYQQAVETLRASRDRLAHTLLDRETLDEEEAYAAAGISRETAPATGARAAARLVTARTLPVRKNLLPNGRGFTPRPGLTRRPGPAARWRAQCPACSASGQQGAAGCHE